MATGQDGKAFKQDMVVSIRYRNDLPPPPMPPKLLDIDHEGIVQYLTTGFASGIARKEPQNIDVDAEGGMAVDMIGVPGYFQGDESAIMAPDVPPMLDQADLHLLMTPEQLKTDIAMNAGHSFLRKTQYMNAANARAGTDPFMSAPRQKKQADKSTAGSVARDDPENIKRNIQKGFDLAYPDSMTYDSHKGEAATAQERNAWSNPKHPSNPNLKPISFHPILPDFDATTDGGFRWNYAKFAKPPLPTHHDKRDPRIDAGFLMAYSNTKEHESWQARKDAFDKDPQSYEDPGPEPHIWPLYIPSETNASSSAVNKIRRVFNDGDPDKDDTTWLSELATADGNGDLRVQFDRTRVYGSVKQEYPDPRRFMALTLFDASTADPGSRHRKQGSAAYYYPIWERDLFKSERGKVDGAKRVGGRQDDDEYADTAMPDQLMLLPHKDTSIPATTKYIRAQWRAQYDYTFADQLKELEAEALAEQAKNQANQATETTEDVNMADGEANRSDRDNNTASAGAKGATGDDESDLMEDD